MLDHGLDVHGLAPRIAAEVADAGEDSDRLTFLANSAAALCAKDPSVFHEILDSTKGSDTGTALALRLIEESGVPVDAQRASDGASPLHCAASAGSTKVLRALLEHKTDANAV